ncbi:hypothetical protein NQ314_007525 [Rhamnusium bicolor]|uniref:Uncharacterized protein n=1 Tax=Rhamnusium bicolor TaxID=1586634 RepID=A0AAV8YNG2_9CUCU|nr:hypothetical protein NQ314_007525 [Rhamnusium bicolor]
MKIFIVAPDFFSFSGKSLYSSTRNAKLVQGDLQLALDFIVMGLDFSELEGLFLDGLLEVNVDFIGTIQRHFEFGDLDLQLLLNASDFGLEPGFGFNNARIELLNFNAGGLTAIEW